MTANFFRPIVTVTFSILVVILIIFLHLFSTIIDYIFTLIICSTIINLDFALFALILIINCVVSLSICTLAGGCQPVAELLQLLLL